MNAYAKGLHLRDKVFRRLITFNLIFFDASRFSILLNAFLAWFILLVYPYFLLHLWLCSPPKVTEFFHFLDNLILQFLYNQLMIFVSPLFIFIFNSFIISIALRIFYRCALSIILHILSANLYTSFLWTFVSTWTASLTLSTAFWMHQLKKYGDLPFIHIKVNHILCLYRL